MSKVTTMHYLTIYLVFHSVIFQVFTERFDQLRSSGIECPIGFNYLQSTNLCYQVKRNENFSQKYERCSGNEVSLNFRDEYLEVFPNYGINLIWTDYVRAYDGGPFINWRYEDEEMGKPVNVTIQSDNYYHECVFMEISTGKLKSDYCNTTYSRLCVIKPYSDSYPYLWDCPAGYTAYPSPVPSCLISKNIVTSTPRRVLLRATWPQASQLCKNEFGYLPQRGYIYLNHEEFAYIGNQEIPLGMTVDKGVTKWAKPYNASDSKVSIYEQRFQNPNTPHMRSGHVALINNEWVIKQGNVVYNNAVCESFVKLPAVDINFINQKVERLYVNVSENIKNDDLWCFTDSTTYHPVKINIYPILKSFERTYYLETLGNGYYWCTLVNSREFIPKDSQKYLFVKKDEDLRRVFAIKIKFYKDVGFSESFIKEYLKSFFSDYNKVFGNNKSEVLERLKDENGTLPDYMVRNKPLLDNITVKYIFFENNMALIHATFVNEFLKNYKLFKSFNFIYVRNVRYCEPVGILDQSEIGDVIDVVDECKRYACSGDFNEGAFWSISNLEECIPRTTITGGPDSNSTDTTTTPEFTTPYPTTTLYSTTPLVEETTTTKTTTTTQPTTRPPTLSPAEEVDNVLNVIDDILNGPVNTSQVNDAVEVISNLFESAENVQIPSEVLHGIEAILTKVDLPEDKQDLKVVRPNLAVVVADKSRNSTVAGIKLKSGDTDSFGENSLHLIGEDDEVTHNETNDIVVRVPKNVQQNSQGRILFTVFRDDRPFSQNESRVNSRILSVSVNGMDIFKNNRYIDLHFRPQTTHLKNESKVCAYWKFNTEGGGSWATDGCTFLSAAGPGGLDTCRCTHLTHFAQLITGNTDNFDEKNYNILTIISMVGCVLSLIGLVIIALTGIMFRSWRCDFSNKIWLHLSAAMAILIFTFLLVAFGNMSKEKEAFCIVTGVLLHYSVLASFGWMFMSAVLSYQRLVTVFTKSSSHKLLKACICGWVLPFIPIGFLFAFDPNSYSQHLIVDQLENEICYPSGLGLWLSVYLPIAVIVFINGILFFLIVYSVFINSKIKRHGDSKQLFRSITVSFLLFFLFGLTWIFGLFSHDIIMAYLFCITATNQGLVLCLFFIIGNKKTRDLWLIQLKIKEKKKLPSTTSMSRSYPSRGNSKSGGKIMSIKRSDDDLPTKPRSLSVRNDKCDSRFS